MTRKTSKYYREALKNNPSEAALKEIVKKYGYKNSIAIDAEYVWNHRIDRICIGTNGNLYFNVYWQGDSTDGNAYVPVSEVRNGGAFIPAEHYVLDQRTYENHGDIRVGRGEYDDAIKSLLEYLSPKAIKERKEAEVMDKALKKTRTLIKKEFSDRLRDNRERYSNAMEMTCDYAAANAKKLLAMSDTEFSDCIAKIFKANY